MGVGFEADRDTDPDWIWGPRGTGSGAMEALVVELLPGEPGALSEFLEGHGAEADLLQVGEVADLLGASCTWLSLPPGAGEGGLRRVLSALPHAAGVFLRLGQPGPGSLGTRHMWAVGSHAEVAKLAGGAG